MSKSNKEILLSILEGDWFNNSVKTRVMEFDFLSDGEAFDKNNFPPIESFVAKFGPGGRSEGSFVQIDPNRPTLLDYTDADSQSVLDLAAKIEREGNELLAEVDETNYAEVAKEFTTWVNRMSGEIDERNAELHGPTEGTRS